MTRTDLVKMPNSRLESFCISANYEASIACNCVKLLLPNFQVHRHSQVMPVVM